MPPAIDTCDETQGQPLLAQKLSEVLPKSYKFGLFHVSTPPKKTGALCSAPPQDRDDKTYCENHFLTITIDATKASTVVQDVSSETGTPSGQSSPQVAVMAVEILIYSTAHSSTFFISKADSTGYLSLLGLPKGTPSPIRAVCACFVSHLLEHRRRKGIQSIVNLFARAQDQYLFPGSIENKTKHVLDDRGLVKWWCRVLDPLLRHPPPGSHKQWGDVKGYLVVPGHDKYETRAFLPRDRDSSSHWVTDHPLGRISHYTKEYDWVPPRCLIPRYPDDPKSRFREELDDESARSKEMQKTGMWKSVRTVEQFWELMAYRQECSSGRLTGFIWIVFDPHAPPKLLPEPSDSSSLLEPPSTPSKKQKPAQATTPRKILPPNPAEDSPSKTNGKATKRRRDEKSGSKLKKQKKKLTGKVRPRQPQIKTRQRNYLLNQLVTSAYYYWPVEGRGQKIMSESDYKRSMELLLHLDFASIDLATNSTKRWLNEVGLGEDWGHHVVGRQLLPSTDAQSATTAGSGVPAVNNLSGLVKRKRAEADTTTELGNGHQPKKVNVLGAGLVRKKPSKVEDQTQVKDETETRTSTINVLGAGVVRKKDHAE